MMPVLFVTGGSGQVGYELSVAASNHGFDAVSCSRGELDITDKGAVRAILAKYSPDVVVNAAAYTAVDKAESDRANAFAVNRDGPAFLAEYCSAHNIPLVHISTDYVFDGTKKSAYVEDDPVNPCGVYALSKWEGEESVRNTMDEHIIVRTSWVFGRHGSNFVKTILKAGINNRQLRIVSDQRGCPTYAAHVAQVILGVARHIVKGEDVCWGTYHYCDTPVTTWFGFAERIFERAVSNKLIKELPEIIPVSTSEYITAARRPANSELECSKIREMFGIEQKSWLDGLDSFFAFIEDVSE
jgi:dTDP-4-dehydrorhamnose reductase